LLARCQEDEQRPVADPAAAGEPSRRAEATDD